MHPDTHRRPPARSNVTQPARLRLGALAIALAVAAPAGQAKRSAPAPVPPVLVDGVRYEVPRMGQPLGDAPHAGIVVARRVDTGELVWTRRAYVVVRDPHKEGDVQDVFIKALTLAPDGRHLDIVDERGHRFEMSLDGRDVRAIPAAP